MLTAAVALLFAVASPVTGSEPARLPRPAEPPRPSWSAEQVRQWAVAEAPVAGLLELERRSLAATLDGSDESRRERIGLLHAVLAHLANHDRNEAAAGALRTYCRIAGLEAQQALLADAEDDLETLVDMAERAEALELPDGDSRELRRRQLSIRDQKTRAEFAARKLRRQLARQTGRPIGDAESADLSDPLPSELAVEQFDDALETALERRSDLRAVKTLCRCMNESSLPAARSLLGVLQPGLGLAVPPAARRTLLAAMHHTPEAPDLACRRQQCRSLRDKIRDTIADEVAAAELDLRQADRRIELAKRQVSLADRDVSEAETAVRLDRSPPGSERLARLELIRLRAETIDRRVELALADVELRAAQGRLSAASSR